MQYISHCEKAIIHPDTHLRQERAYCLRSTDGSILLILRHVSHPLTLTGDRKYQTVLYPLTAVCETIFTSS